MAKPSPGDFTGRTKMQNERTQKEIFDERDTEIAAMNSIRQRDEVGGIFDPKTGELVQSEPQRGGVAVLEDDNRDQQQRPQRRPFFERNSEPVLTGKEDAEELAPVLAERRTFSMPPEILHQALIVVRIDSDVDNMTYGFTENGEPNNFTFKEGLKYELSYDLVEHLNNLGYIRQFLNN